jgi:hypothetical protein
MPAPIPSAQVMPFHIQITAIVLSAMMLIITIELIRRNRLREDYALLWLAGGLVMLVLSVWPGSIKLLARLTGTVYPPSAIFVAAIVTVIWLLLHFSVIVSTLTARLIKLSQRMAILEMRIVELEGPSSGESAPPNET